jgi:hypothetical protein
MALAVSLTDFALTQIKITHGKNYSDLIIKYLLPSVTEENRMIFNSMLNSFMYSRLIGINSKKLIRLIYCHVLCKRSKLVFKACNKCEIKDDLTLCKLKKCLLNKTN